ncbi:hypothetical protein Lbir_0988 [Legionella birminghamensis]|uniref:Uncharacterized protein n=1 Tax=Legionella birminghamensis TaxID=28083 RepID=A0A378IDS1_9GAMM|nr:hypothetical protein [Legionella birminghamensis]KTC73932.1 hypothetical protein Lbir_0988 [Legionella birminghamensis]STX30424.1 Uncharacterised protein [Legionella birminghamensis]
MVKYHCLDGVNTVFALALMMLAEKAHHNANYGLPGLSSGSPLIETVTDLSEAREFAVQLLSHIPLWKKVIQENKSLVPDAVKFALATADEMNELARNYSGLFAGYLQAGEDSRINCLQPAAS